MAVSITEKQACMAIHTPNSSRENQRKRRCAGRSLICIADRRKGFVVPALFIGLKVNAIESSSADVSAGVIMTDIFEVHDLIYDLTIYDVRFNCDSSKSSAKVRGLVNGVVALGLIGVQIDAIFLDKILNDIRR